jgi:hypothetical protein
MWEILKAFNLGSGDNITCYHPGQSVPDGDFSKELVETKLLPNGWVTKREEAAPLPPPQDEPEFKKFKKNYMR